MLITIIYKHDNMIKYGAFVLDSTPFLQDLPHKMEPNYSNKRK